MSGRLFSNAFAFELKRQSVLVETHLRLKENVLALVTKRKGVFLIHFSQYFLW
jgi:hypothetical protein